MIFDNLLELHPAVIAYESLASCLEEAKPILEEHWKEITVYRDIPLDPEYDLYETLEKTGSLAIYTIRVQGELVGYSVYFVRRHLHYRNHVWANNDILLVRKPYRNFGIGKQLLDFVENDLRSRGVNVIHHGTKTAHPELALLLQSRGHQRVEVGYSFRLS